MSANEKACSACAKAHLVPHGLAGLGLECRALPPVQDIARFARFPTVREDHFCHTYFERAPAAGPEDSR